MKIVAFDGLKLHRQFQKIDDRMMAINAHVQQLEVKRSRHYGSMTKCVIYHESILQ